MFGTFRPLAGALAVLATLALTNAAPAQKPFDDPVLERMRKDVFFLAGPECEGRGVETKGIQKAADYVAEAFGKAGLKPAMKNGTYFQPFNTVLDPAPAEPTALTFADGDTKKELSARHRFRCHGRHPDHR